MSAVWFFLLLAVAALTPESSYAQPSCSQQVIYVHPPAALGISNLASENFIPHPTQNAFLVGSLVGNVFVVSCSGDAVQLTNVSSSASFITGVKINPYDNLLYVAYCNLPPKLGAPTGQGFVGVFNYTTGATIAFVDFTPYGNITAGLLLNDFVFQSGVAYVTDSLSNRIYSFDTTTYQPSVYSASPLYAGLATVETEGLAVGADGCFYPPGADYFVVSKISDGSGTNPGIAFLKVPASNPNSPSPVKIINQTSTIAGGFDGVWYDSTNCNLYGANHYGEIYRFYSEDDWSTAVLDELGPVSVVIANASLGFTVSAAVTPSGDVYAINAGGFNPYGIGTIEKVIFATAPTNRCTTSSSASLASFSVFRMFIESIVIFYLYA